VKNIDYTPFKFVFGFSVYFCEWCSVACFLRNITRKYNATHFHPAFEVFPFCCYVEEEEDDEEEVEEGGGGEE